MKTMLSIAALGTIAALSAAGVAAQEGGRPFTVEMTGAAEVPGPGDEDGSGTATLRVNPGQGRVCYRSEEHTSELQSLMRISYAVFCLKKKKNKSTNKPL